MEDGIITRDDERFPDKLKTVKPSVKQIWYRGDWQSEIFEKCIAVVGSRKMSRYGKQVLSEIIPKLCSGEYTIVSGLMYGVDQEAHKLTLECGGRAVAVLGYGIGARSEEGASQLADKIVESGGVVMSEYPENLAPKRWMFLQRNRIVCSTVTVSDCSRGRREIGYSPHCQFGQEKWERVVCDPWVDILSNLGRDE